MAKIQIIHIEPADNRRRLNHAERIAALQSWYRIVDTDGSTIAYTPGIETAKLIVETIEFDKGET